MPDANYEVVLTITSLNAPDGKFEYGITGKSTTGFTIWAIGSDTTSTNSNPISMEYTAFKLYTDTEYNDLLEKVSKIGYVRDSITVDSTKNVASTIKANCISAGILRSVNYPCLVTNRNTGDVCKVYLSQATGDLLAGETISAGTYDISTFYPIA